MAYKTYLTTGSHVYVTDVWGPDSGRDHNGMDIVLYTNPAFIRCVKAGRVTRSAYSESYGNVVYISTGSNEEMRYAHMAQLPVVEVGRQVVEGDILGIMGSTGWSTGPHVHIELRRNNVPSDPSSAIGIPNALGDKQTEWPTADNPPDPKPPPAEQLQNGSVVVVTCTFKSGRVVSYPATQTGTHLYFNDSGFFRCHLDGTKVEHFWENTRNWSIYTEITKVDVGGWDVSSISSTVLESISRLAQIINELANLSQQIKALQQDVADVYTIIDSQRTKLTEVETLANSNRTRIASAEGDIKINQMDISNLDDRVTALEKGGV